MKNRTVANVSILPSAWALVLAALVGIALPACDRRSTPETASTPQATSTATEAGAPQGRPLDEVLSEPDPYLRVQRLAALLPTLGPEAVPEAKRRLQKAALGGAESELLVRYWATYDPAAAADWALNLASPRVKISAIATAVEVWAQNDPEAAVAGVTWAAQGGIRDVAQTVQVALVQGWFKKDRAGLEKYMQGLGSGLQRQRSVFAYALALARSEGSDAVMRWAEAVPDDDVRYKRMVYRQVTVALAWADPAGAQRWCDAECEGPYGGRLRGILGRVELQTGEDGKDILDWLSRAPEGESKDRALRVTFDTWGLRDRERALQWFAQQTAGDEEPPPWVHTLYGAYARQLAAESPAEAIPWAERVENDVTREEILVRIARQWLRKDHDAAEAWLEKSSLSEKARARARNLKLPSYLPDVSGDSAPKPAPGKDPAAGAEAADEPSDL